MFMRSHLPPLGLALAFLLAPVYSAMARPATAKDLAGRTICFDNGEKPTYTRDGKWENNWHGIGAWKVTPAGVEIRSDTFSGVLRVEMRNDGTILDTTYNIAGKFCK
jgi:hypothetical protein